MILVLVYMPFLLSESLQLSGIVTVLFSGISARRYICKNISEKARKLSSFVFMLMSHMSETVVFLSLGMSVFADGKLALICPALVGWTLLLITVGRALHVYPLLTMVGDTVVKIERNAFLSYQIPCILGKRFQRI